MADKKDMTGPLTDEEMRAFEALDLDALLADVDPDAKKSVPEKDTLPPLSQAAPHQTPANPARPARSHGGKGGAVAVAERPAPVKKEKDIPIPASLRAKPEKPPKTRRFGRSLLIYLGVFVVLLVIGCGIFWKYLEYYEASRPEPVVEQYLQSVDDAYWESLVMGSTNLFPTTEFEKSEDIAYQCVEAIRGCECTYHKRTGEYTAETPVYTIRVGDYDIAKLTLREYAALGFGFHSWAADTVELAGEFVPAARSVTISVPDGAQVSLNGILLDEKYITDTVPYTGLGELEQQFTTPLPSTSVYTVAGLYGNIELTVTDADGKTLNATKADGLEYEYEMQAETRTVTITAPENAVVELCGVTVPDSYITETKPIELLERVSAYVTDSASAAMCTYTVPGIYTKEITVTAKDSTGKVLSGLEAEDGSWSFGWGTGSIPSDREELVKDYMQAYLNFTSDVYDATDSNWYALQQYILYDGDVYQRMEMALDGLEWTRSSEAVMHACDVLSYAEFGDSCFIARVTMDYSVTRTNGVTDDVTSFDLVFVDDGDGFVVETMEAI